MCVLGVLGVLDRRGGPQSVILILIKRAGGWRLEKKRQNGDQAKSRVFKLPRLILIF